jgi:hypothetical protein
MIKMKTGKTGYNFISRMMMLLILAAVFSVFLFATGSFKGNSLELQSRVIEDTVRKYLIQCYASEGAYPENLQYLAENYGLIIDNENYIYLYQSFSSNILPDIKVYAKPKTRSDDIIDF